MEYYMMNDTTFYCPEWQTPDMMNGCEVAEATESENGIRKFFPIEKRSEQYLKNEKGVFRWRASFFILKVFIGFLHKMTKRVKECKFLSAKYING